MSEESAYDKLTAFMTGLEERSNRLWSREQEIAKELAAKEAAYGEATIRGDHRAAEGRIVALKAELAATQKERFFVTNPPRTGILAELTKAAWQEAVDEITVNLRGRWNQELLELERTKAEFLASVARLGRIKAEGDHITSRTQEAILSVPGPKLAPPSLSTGIISRPDRKAGPIYIDAQESERAFKGGK